jgi:alpha-1,6-mannosyltransferase
MTTVTHPLPRIHWGTVRLAVTAAGLVALTAAGPSLHIKHGSWVLMLIFAAGGTGILFALPAVDRSDQQDALIVILVGGVLMRLALLFVEPYLSTDVYRYVWDGRVQAAGINPYRYVPAAPEVAHLRDTVIFPSINRPDHAVTIYPPAAQAIFFAVTRFGESVVAMKLGLIGFEAVMVGILLALLHRLGQPLTRIAAYAWHPLAIWEVAGSGHVDIAMCALLMAGLLLFLRGRTLLAGAVVALGALVKPTALLALPVFWRPWTVRLPLVVMFTALLAYLPYLSVGSGVFGYLWGYIDEEGLASGRGFNALWLMERWTGAVPAAVGFYVAIATTIMAGLAIAVAFRRDRSPQTTIACFNWLLVTFLVLVSPHYPWYFLVLVPLLVIHGSATAWVLTLTCPLLYASIDGAGWPNYDARIAAFTIATVAALAYDARKLLRKSPDLGVGEIR